jgi:Kef-type K+ transport system membrane component KefB
MFEKEFIANLGMIIVVGVLFALIARRIKMPTIAAYLLAGVVLGPATGMIELTTAVELISKVGIALLLFLVGLELSFSRIRDVGMVSIIAGLGQVVFTALGGLVVSLVLGFSWMDSLFLAVALTFSGTVVVVKLLDEKKELNTLYGRIAVGIFLVQDLVVVVILTFLAGVGREEQFSLAAVSRGLGLAFAGMAMLLGLALLAARFFLPRPFSWASRSPETLFIWSLAWCFVMVWTAQWLELSLEIGAFLAGISLAQLPYNHDLRRRVHPLMNFFIAVFFVSLGIRMELEAAFVHWLTVVVLSLFVLIGNPFIFIWIIARMGYGERTSFLTSVTVAQISEFSFIFAGVGVAGGLIGAEILSITALVGLVTIAASAYMILYNHQLYGFFSQRGLLRFFRARTGIAHEPPPAPERKNHIIIVGMNSLGRELAIRLQERGESVLALDTDPKKLEGLPCETLLGNAEHLSLLEEAGLSKARLLISALQIEDTNDLLAYFCRQHGIPCSIHVVDLSVIDNLLEMDPSYLMIPKVDGIKRQNRELQRLGILNP